MKRRVTLRYLALVGTAEESPVVEMEANERIVHAEYIQALYQGSSPGSGIQWTYNYTQSYWSIVIERPA